MHALFLEIQGGDVRMPETGRDFNLLEESLATKNGGQLRAEDLECHLAAVFQVLGEIDRGHAARANFFLDGIAVGEGGREPGGDVGDGD